MMIELVDYIRLFSRDGRLVTAEQIIAVAGLELEIEEIDTAHQALIADSKYQDIKLIKGKSGEYLYSTKYIVEAYAKQWVGVKDGDVLETISDYIRRYAALGEVVIETNFTYPPYNVKAADLPVLAKQLVEHEGNADIGYNEDKSGVKHYYSTKSMTANYANVLANHDPFRWSV